MQRFVTLAALVLAAGCATDPSAQSGPSQEVSRIVKQADLPLIPQGPAAGTKGLPRLFQAGATRGSVADSGEWALSTDVTHQRLRCATYETGIQIGRGDASCTKVEWLANPEYGSRRTQCNGATLIHSAGGTLLLPPAQIESASCVRVLVRCTGAC